MSLRLIKHTDHLEILEGELPEGQEVRLFTEQEVLQFEGWRKWASLSQEQREDMLLQTQSAAYKEWMDEDEWDCLPLGEPGQAPYGT